MSSSRVSLGYVPLPWPLRRGLALLSIFALAVLSHVESLSYWFVSTDVFGLIESSRVTSLADLVGLFAEPMMDGTRFTEVGLFYRPVSSLSYALDHAIWGLEPWGYHLTNLLLHGFAAVLVAVAMAALLDRPLVGYLSALLFAIHPLTAEVVPTAARRQDVLLTLFVMGALALFVRAHRKESRPALVGALVAYGLALGSKEIGIILPGVVAAWVLVRPDLAASRSFGSDSSPPRADPAVLSDGGYADDRFSLLDRVVRPRVDASLRATTPFLGVTLVYLLVRVAALGGLGGYEGGSLAAGDLPLIPLDYLLSVFYQSNVIWASVSASSRWLLLLVPATCLLGLALDRYGASPARLHSPALVARAGFVYGLGLLAYVLVFGPELVRSLPPQFRYPWLVSVLVGACFVLGCLSGIGSLLLARDPPFGAVASSLAFFGVWLTLPVALFYAGGEFTMRSGYPFLAPAMAALSVLAIDALCTLRRHWFTTATGANRPDDPGQRGDSSQRSEFEPSPGAGVVLLCLVALLVVPQVAVSPLFHSYDGWETTGEINERTLTALDGAIERESAAQTDRFVVRGLVNGVSDQRHAFPRAESVGYLRENSIESWLRLTDHGTVRVRVVDTASIPASPDDVSLSSTRRGARTEITIRYRFDETAALRDANGIDHGAR